MTDKVYYNDDDMLSLPSIRNYKHIDTYKYNDFGNSGLCTTIKNELNDYVGIYDLCMDVTGILNNFNKSRITSLFDNEQCTVFNYWMYHHLYNNLTEGNDSRSVSSFIFKLLEYRKDYIKDDKCTIDIKIIFKDHFIKTKMLHDYALDYKTIKSKVESPDAECSKSYNAYIVKHSENYNKVKEECRTNESLPYCALYTKITEYLLPLRACRQKDSTLRTRHGEVMMDTFQGALSEGGHGDEFGRRMGHENSGELHFPLTAQAHRTSNSSTIMSILFPVLGILFSFFILYRFTPAGSLLNTYLLKKKKFRTHVDEEETEHMLENTYEYVNRNMGYDTHHIGYNGLENP
ncbi:PIR Superfamily Protein [Plasmodium ovale curtisi]|uniref:PIR Superfamily Protein n=1 Tax=Plasmodium ovale curtisi TaxID=864141 RepID=A0A1A8X564_PLAOA|nr:PIR Superfamily Protein [Plasmodium ovale curtisi]